MGHIPGLERKEQLVREKSSFSYNKKEHLPRVSSLTSVVLTRGMIYRGVAAMSEVKKKVLLRDLGEDGAVVFVVRTKKKVGKTNE